MFLSPDSSLLQLRGPCLSQNKPFFNRQGNKSATSPLDDTKSSTLELKKKLKDLLEDLSFSSYFLFIKIGAHLMSVFVLPVVGVVGHGGQKLQEAVEGVAVARWEQVDQKLGDILLLIWVQHCNNRSGWRWWEWHNEGKKKRKEDKHDTRWKSGEEREAEAYTWCWWRPCRAPWLEEGRACPWGTPSAEQPRRECCAPRPAGRRRRGQTPRAAEVGDEKKREGGKEGGIKKHPLHRTMDVIFSEGAHAHACSLPVGPCERPGRLRAQTGITSARFYLIFYHLTFGWLPENPTAAYPSPLPTILSLSARRIHFSVFRLQMVANA